MTTMRLPPEVWQVLGVDRAKTFEERARALRSLVESAPEATNWVTHLPVKLWAATPEAAYAELERYLYKHDPAFTGFLVVTRSSDGSRFGSACEYFEASERPNTDDTVAFMFFDLHTRLGAWWLTHVWRAADLGAVVESTLARWEVLPAAACARAQLEGVAAFSVESEQLLEAWSHIKRSGAPSERQVHEFRGRFLEKLGQAQFASRIGERAKKGSRIKRTNIMTLLDKFSRRLGDEVENFWHAYEWLCDAVHPSWGFSTVYVADRGVHSAGITVAETLARRVHIAPTRRETFEPTVAWAVVDALDIAVRHLLVASSRVRWLIDDIGFTTGVAFRSTLEGGFVGSIRRPEPLADCPCGSGQSFEKCVHRWGVPAEPRQ